MKRYIISGIISLLAIVAYGQVDRSVAPEPGPAPEIKIPEYQSFELKNGLKVYVVENHKLPRVAFSLSLDNDPIIEGEKAGYVGITGQLMRNGTTNRKKEQLDEEIDFIGASLSTSSSGVFASSLTRHKEKLLELMTDVLFNPAFDEDELEKIRKQTLSGLAAAKEDPSSIASNVSSVVSYGKDHPYGELTLEETVENITIEDCHNFYQTYFKPNVAYMAVVGDITLKEAKKLVKKYFKNWEAGDIPRPNYDIPKGPEETFIALVDRPSSVQSVINITYPLELKPGHPDVIKSNVMNQILGGSFSSRLMQNLREDKAFTYGARSSISSDKLVGSFSASASVRNEVTDSAVYEFIYELKKITEEGVTEEELSAAKAYLTGSFARAMERPQTVANFAINTAVYNLPADYYNNYLKNVAGTTLQDVREMANKYIRPDKANIVIVGKASDVGSKLQKFGEVRYFDITGNEYEPSPAALLPEGLTAEQVIENFINAVGGKEKLKAVESMRVKMNADMMGNPVEMVLTKKGPNMLNMVMSMAGNEVMRQAYDGEKGTISQMGQSMNLEGERLKEMDLEARLFPEMVYSELGMKTELVGVEKVNGKDAYIVEVSFPSGTKFSEYYDVESGFKVRESRVVEGPQGEMLMASDISDYKEVEGIMVPHEIIQPLGGGMKMVLKVASIEFNTEVADEVFK